MLFKLAPARETYRADLDWLGLGLVKSRDGTSRPPPLDSGVVGVVLGVAERPGRDNDLPEGPLQRREKRPTALKCEAVNR